MNLKSGLHSRSAEALPQLIFELSEQLDVQVFATTHSWDCIESFTKVGCSAYANRWCAVPLKPQWAAPATKAKIATVFDEVALQNITRLMWKCDEQQKHPAGRG